MDGERTFLSYLNDFDDRAQALLPAPVASLIASVDVTSPNEASDALSALRHSGHACPETDFLLGLCAITGDHDRSPEVTDATSDILAHAIESARELRSPEDFALFFVFATTRYYDVLGWAMSVKDEAMRLVEERLEKLEELSGALNIAQAALETLARAAGVSDEDNASVLREACLVCDEVFTCGAGVAIELAKNLTRPSALSSAALEEWYNFPSDIEACSAQAMTDYGEHPLSELIRPQTGLVESARRSIERNEAAARR